MSDVSSDMGIEQPPTTSSTRALNQLRDKIIREWERRVRAEIKGASKLQRPVIVDTIPTFLDNLAEALSREHPRTIATETTTIAQEHGGERARLSHYGPEQLIFEYQLLQKVVLEQLSPVVPLSEHERSIIQKSFDQAIQEAMMAYFLVHSRIREQFVAGLSHDLRGPLSSAKLSAELILRTVGSLGGDELRDRLEILGQRIVSNMKRADRMIQDLLDASVLQIGEKLQFNMEAAEMLKIVNDVIAELPAKERARVRVTGNPVQGYWDREGIRRAIENVVNNAIKYGTPDRPIIVRVTETYGRVLVHVHNEGRPIPVNEQEFLFQPFRRSETAKSSGKKGWGIGLALVRGVAEGHGGSVGVDSSFDKGTTFMLDIPVDARPFAMAG